MRWRKHRKTSSEDEQVARDMQAVHDALEALDQDIVRARRRTSEIMEISRTLRSLGEQNHFAPMVLDALGGRFG